LTTEHRLTTEVVEELYETYHRACTPLLTLAAARHVLSAPEFLAEMRDPRIEKLVIWDRERPVALATMTNDLSAIPWVSAEYYRARYPDAAERGVLYYLGYIFVGESHRRTNALLMMTDRVNRRLSDSEGVLAFDFCRFNDEHQIGKHAARLLSSSHHIDALDVQSYYAADYRAVR